MNPVRPHEAPHRINHSRLSRFRRLPAPERRLLLNTLILLPLNVIALRLIGYRRWHALLGAWLLATEPAVYTRQLPTTPISLEGLMAASTIALFAMLGIESAAIPAGRVNDPGKTIPRATMVGTLLTAAIYIAVSSIALLLLRQ